MSEKVLGALEVEAQLRLGSQQLILLLTERRLILSHVGKMGRESLALSSILGKFAGAVGSLGKKDEALARMASLSPDTILGLDSGNFDIDFGDIVSISSVREEGGRSRIIILTKDSKIELRASSVAVEGIKGLVVSLLKEKAVYRA